MAVLYTRPLRFRPPLLVGILWLVGFIVAPALLARSEHPTLQDVLAVKPWSNHLIRLPFLFLAYGSFANYFNQRRSRNSPDPTGSPDR